MNWQILLQTVLNVVEKNPALAEELLLDLMKLFVENKDLLHEAVTLGVTQMKASQVK